MFQLPNGVLHDTSSDTRTGATVQISKSATFALLTHISLDVIGTPASLHSTERPLGHRHLGLTPQYRETAWSFKSLEHTKTPVMAGSVFIKWINLSRCFYKRRVYFPYRSISPAGTFRIIFTSCNNRTPSLGTEHLQSQCLRLATSVHLQLFYCTPRVPSTCNSHHQYSDINIRIDFRRGEGTLDTSQVYSYPNY